MYHKSFIDSLTFEYVNAFDVKRACQLESEGFPPEEAFTLERFTYIQNAAPTLFLGAYLSDSYSTSFKSMSYHNSFGKTVSIHTICVDKLYRRRGVALCMLKEYIKRLKNESQNRDMNGKYERIALICHEHLIPFYQKAGFILKGESEIIY
ncbi:23475_t:CDS:2, partial [Gigaspora rosea]